MQAGLQATIDDLKEQLRKEREDGLGTANEIKQKLQAEIEELKK